MKILFSILSFLSGLSAGAQELFTWSEPASNMAAKAVGFRATSLLMKQTPGQPCYAFVPEIMLGLSARTMLHIEGFFDNDNNKFSYRGEAFYVKYRFYSRDEIHSHFRMAGYLRGALNNAAVYQAAIEINRNNSGFESGVILTRLINRTAFSGTAGFVHAGNNLRNKFAYEDDRNALNYTFSIGKLILPEAYINYRQINLNLMLEFPGQLNFGSGNSYLDAATAVQFIILSRMRIDAGYRFAMIKDLERSSNNSFLLRLEYNIFNVYK